MSAATTHALDQVVARPDRDVPPEEHAEVGDLERKLPAAERLLASPFIRKGAVIVTACALWQAYAMQLDDPLLVPSLTETMAALWQAMVSGVLPGRIWTSMQILLISYLIGTVGAVFFSAIGIFSRAGAEVVTTLTSMFNPLPAVALLPLALLWFGLGTTSVVFVVVYSVMWPLTLNMLGGFRGVSGTLRMVGQNYGLGGARFLLRVLIPAALPSIIIGLRIAWAFAWRTLIASELVFGVTSRSGGLGWYIFENRTALETANVFAGLLMVIAIGMLVESVLFRTLEKLTIGRWGVQR